MDKIQVSRFEGKYFQVSLEILCCLSLGFPVSIRLVSQLLNFLYAVLCIHACMPEEGMLEMVSLWVLGIELGTLGRADSAFNLSVSPDPKRALWFLTEHISIVLYH